MIGQQRRLRDGEVSPRLLAIVPLRLESCDKALAPKTLHLIIRILTSVCRDFSNGILLTVKRMWDLHDLMTREFDSFGIDCAKPTNANSSWFKNRTFTMMLKQFGQNIKFGTASHKEKDAAAYDARFSLVGMKEIRFSIGIEISAEEVDESRLDSLSIDQHAQELWVSPQGAKDGEESITEIDWKYDELYDADGEVVDMYGPMAVGASALLLNLSNFKDLFMEPKGAYGPLPADGHAHPSPAPRPAKRRCVAANAREESSEEEGEEEEEEEESEHAGQPDRSNAANRRAFMTSTSEDAISTRAFPLLNMECYGNYQAERPPDFIRAVIQEHNEKVSKMSHDGTMRMLGVSGGHCQAYSSTIHLVNGRGQVFHAKKGECTAAATGAGRGGKEPARADKFKRTIDRLKLHGLPGSRFNEQINQPHNRAFRKEFDILVRIDRLNPDTIRTGG